MVGKPKVLIVEDDETVAAGLRSAMEDEFEIVVTGRNPAALIRNQAWEPRVRLLDLESLSRPNPEDGLRVLQGLRHAGHAGKVIVYTSCTERCIAVGAIRYGAMDVLSKPLDIPVLKGIVRRAVRIADLEEEVEAGMTDGGHEEFNGMLGTSANIRWIFDAIRKVATNDAPLLISGESGTGKELTAKAIHEGGLRKQASFIPSTAGPFLKVHWTRNFSATSAAH